MSGKKAVKLKENVETPDQKVERMSVLTKGTINQETYEVSDKFVAGSITPQGVHTVSELMELLEKDSTVDVEGVFIAGGQDKVRLVKLDRKQILEHASKNSRKNKSFKKFFESFDRGFDFGTSANLVGEDYVPILGGPFNKQLYLHDSLRMFALGFHAYHHDPIARGLVHITRDFTLGRGFTVNSKDSKALAVWRAFEKANSLQQYMRYVACELSYNGEVMIWWLPDNLTAVAWQDPLAQMPSRGLIPRIRPIDPSTVWEIITMPEDISRVIAYQQVFPTQYNMYTAKVGGENVPSSKFVMQQIPADQVDHHKVNCASNEKRGRSDLFPAFGMLKRLRDSVNYSIIALQKMAAWAIDTTINGSPTDIQSYVDEQNSVPTLTPAGSEFVHSDKIKREYVGNNAAASSSGSSTAFEWILNCICTAVQIPVSYLGTHLSGGQTKASALVGTEPVTKKFEARQLVYEDILQKMWDRVMKLNNIEAECEITFPELITQDRSAKIKDLTIANELKVLSHQTISNIIAKELQITNYNYKAEMEQIKIEDAKKSAADYLLMAPLTTRNKGSGQGQPDASGSAVTSDQKRDAAMNK